MGTPRRPFPVANPDEALRALQSMQSITNVSGLGSRGLDVASGLGDFEPSEAELISAQQQPGMQGLSREQLRSGAMQKVRGVLRMGDTEQQRKLQIAAEKTKAEAEARASQNEAIMARQREMAEMQNTERASAREDAQSFAAQQQAERLAAAQARPRQQQVPTEGMDKRLQEAKGEYEGFNPLNPVRKLLGREPYGRSQYQSALESVLQRTGSLQTLNDAIKEAQEEKVTAAGKIAEAEAAGVKLNAQEKAYLTLMLGQ